MKEIPSITLVVILIGLLPDTMQESITSSLKMEATGRSRTKEVRSTGHSKNNAIESQTTKSKEILVCVCMEIKTYPMLVSIKRCSISPKVISNLS